MGAVLLVPESPPTPHRCSRSPEVQAGGPGGWPPQHTRGILHAAAGLRPVHGTGQAVSTALPLNGHSDCPEGSSPTATGALCPSSPPPLTPALSKTQGLVYLGTQHRRSGRPLCWSCWHWLLRVARKGAGNWAQPHAGATVPDRVRQQDTPCSEPRAVPATLSQCVPCS